ncbi:hypothetical protein [Tulip streak virus]|uniref:Uncharacterized protein n=1 Tax=Tulip streak virus TaxID=2761348 RepID=A0A7R7DYU7_9VIRU|nr:hypothetical protein [Tulip streak virus]
MQKTCINRGIVTVVSSLGLLSLTSSLFFASVNFSLPAGLVREMMDSQVFPPPKPLVRPNMIIMKREFFTDASFLILSVTNLNMVIGSKPRKETSSAICKMP